MIVVNQFNSGQGLWPVALWVILSLTWLVACKPANFLPSPNQPLQIRAGWAQNNSLNSPQTIEALVDRLAAGNFNVLFIDVFDNDRAYYNSQIAPQAVTDFDPLAYLTSAAHQRGLQVHVWLSVGRTGWPTIPLTPGKIFEQHPDWLMVNGCGVTANWLNPVRPEARQFIRAIVQEITRQYDIDGIHLDYVRYPGPGWSFDAYSAEEFASRYQANLANIHQLQLPARAYFTGNPLLSASTAQVLASFDTGEPALLLNSYGDGEVVLFNWDAAECEIGATNEIMRRSLQRLVGPGGELYQFDSEEGLYKTQAWLHRLGWTPTIIAETSHITAMSPEDVLVLPNVYRLQPEITQAIAKFIWGGGGVIWLDGPTPIINDPNVQAITGMQSRGRHFYREKRWLQPQGEHELLLLGPPTWHENLEQNWVSFRAENIRQIVTEIHQDLAGQKHRFVLSAAVFRSQELAEVVGQDWGEWLNSEIIDWAMPMAYVKDSSELTPLLAEWQKQPHFEQIIPGLIVFDEATEVSKSPQELLAEIALVQAGGAHGVVLFDLDRMDQPLLEALANGPFRPAK